MRNLIFSCFILFSFTSCSSYKDSLTPVQQTQNKYTPQFLTVKNLEQVFKVNIEVYRHEFGGVMAIKKIEPQHYRIALITEIGAKLLDFELINGEMKLNYALDQLNKKIILNTLRQDFLILLNEAALVEAQYKKETADIYQARIEGKNVYYFVEKTKLVKTVLAPKSKEKIEVVYTYINSDFPDIVIHHKNIKLKIYMQLLENE